MSDIVKMVFMGLPNRVEEAARIMEVLGFIQVNEDRDRLTPGEVLLAAKHLRGMTTSELSDLSGLYAQHITKMEHGERSISKRMAGILAALLDIDPNLITTERDGFRRNEYGRWVQDSSC